MEPEQSYERKWELGLTWESKETATRGDKSPAARFLSYELFRAAVGEFLGTMLFLFNVITIARFVTEVDDASQSSASTLMIAYGFGLSIFVLVYIMAGVSGANLNPAVSIGLLVGKRITVERFIVYVISQVLGAMAGAGIATVFLSGTGGGFNAIAPGVRVRDAFGGEVLCTFLLVVTVFAATDGEIVRKTGHTGPLLPLVIGMAVLVDHLVLIPVDGCSINPARSFATAVTNDKWADHWVFWVGPLLGGVLATLVWEAILRPDQPVEEKEKPMVQATSV